MDIFNRKRVRELGDAFVAYRRSTNATISEMASRIIIATEETQDGLYSGNRYKTYASQVQALNSMYTAIAKWGVLQTGNIIDVRAAFVVGSGLKLKAKEQTPEAKRALELAKVIFDFNDLPREMLQEMAKEGELEGKLLLKLFPVTPSQTIRGVDGTEFTTMISVRHIPWGAHKYTIQTQPDDYMRYIAATWQPSGSEKVERLEAPDFVFKRFGGRVSDPNITPSKVMKCLTQIEDLDQALRDWREINRLFAAPTPHNECETAEDAKAMQEIVDKLNWKIKKFFAHTGKFSYASPTMEGVASLEKEIITLAKMISGTTGVPVHFLGLPDLMSNRSTADNLFELVYAATQKERETWKGLLAELIDKAIDKYNQTTKLTPIGEGLVEVDIPFVSREQWERLEKVWLPLYRDSVLPLSVLLSKIPDIDAEAVLEEKKKEQADEFDRLKKEVDNQPPPSEDPNIDPNQQPIVKKQRFPFQKKEV